MFKFIICSLLTYRKNANLYSYMPAKTKKSEVVQKNNPVLRQVSTPVPLDKIASAEIKSIISDMKKAIEFQADAVAISAVQIAKPIRIFVISKRVFGIVSGDLEKANVEKDDLVFINPKITKTSKGKGYLEEGCLSVRYFYGKVLRAEKATVQALDENGKKFTRGFSGLFAQIVQHEMDHLDGTLFIDKAKNLQEISHEEYEKSLAMH